MDWLTQNWILILVIIATVFLFRRMGHHGFGDSGSHGYGTPGEASGSGGSSRPQGTTAPHGAPQAAIDPVSGNALKTDHAITSFYGGRVYFFENEATRRRFEAEPERFTTNASGIDARPAEEHHHHRRHGC